MKHLIRKIRSLVSIGYNLLRRFLNYSGKYERELTPEKHVTACKESLNHQLLTQTITSITSEVESKFWLFIRYEQRTVETYIKLGQRQLRTKQTKNSTNLPWLYPFSRLT